MVRRCSVVWDGKSCTSGFDSDSSGTKVISFPKDLDERRLWCRHIPNQLDPEKVTEHMGICLKHWPPNYETKKVRGGHLRPVNPPTVFGNR